MNSYPAFRLTPSNSPFFRNTAPRSPTKLNRSEESGLRLSKVVGTTTTSLHGFDCNSPERMFAYAAGAATVVATVEEDLTVSQRFFKARPTLAGDGREAGGLLASNSPTPADLRNRPLSNVKERGVGGSPLAASRDWSDSPSGKSSTAKDRVKAVTSVALSPNGRWLAVGETGYRPRILLFLLSRESDQPYAAISEHAFGVQALRFSPDSLYLASLGTINDGFLHVWNIGDRPDCGSLHASNKCTTVVNSMVWMGRSIVTAGLRSVKVWRPDEDAEAEGRRLETTLSPHTPRQRATNRSSDFGNSILSPRHKVLAGKNSLLGDMLECNFVSAISVSDVKALLFAEGGEICLLDDATGTQMLSCAGSVDFRTCAASLSFSGTVLVKGSDHQNAQFTVESLTDAAHSDHRNGRTHRKSLSFSGRSTGSRDDAIALARLGQHSLRLTRGGSIQLALDDSDPESHGPRMVHLSMEAQAIAGVQCVKSTALPHVAFLTFSTSGVLQLWDTHGSPLKDLAAPLLNAQEVYGIDNVLTAATPFAEGCFVATGDKVGTLTVLDVQSGSVVCQIRAHSSEIADLCAFKRGDQQLLATAGRDRIVQVFAWLDGKLNLLQTMNEHVGAVTGLLATTDGQFLLSSSADRTVFVREAWLRDEDAPTSVAYVPLRTIATKAAPTSICFGEDEHMVLVASTDRAITKYSINSGQTVLSFKCSDSEGGESVVMSKILFAPSSDGSPAIVGVSSSDKSVRLYSTSGSLIARDWGHTEGITGIALLSDHEAGADQAVISRLVTVAADSTIFLWDTSRADSSQGEEAGLGATPGNNDLMNPPLRRVISYSELSRFRRESSQDEGLPSSPKTVQPSAHSTSPQRLRKKPSRMSVAQKPYFEPAFRTSFAEPLTRSARRSSLRHRSPSPTSPRTAGKRDHRGRPSLGLPLRSKSSENVLSNNIVSPSTTSSFGSLTSSTESVCRTLRAYRKKLANAPSQDSIAPETLRELEKELKLTARVIGERSQGRTVDEAMMARLLDQASEKIVGMLDERIKERVETEIRKSSEASPSSGIQSLTPPDGTDDERADALPGELEEVGQVQEE